MVVGVALAAWAGSPRPPAPPSPDEQVLKSAGIATDGPGLIAYFRRRTPSSLEEATLRQRAAQLGSGTYSVRIKATDELIKAGRVALPWLRKVAKKKDAETARRAQYCIGVIEQNTQMALSATASRVLAERNPPGRRKHSSPICRSSMIR